MTPLREIFTVKIVGAVINEHLLILVVAWLSLLAVPSELLTRNKHAGIMQ